MWRKVSVEFGVWSVELKAVFRFQVSSFSFDSVWSLEFGVWSVELKAVFRFQVSV